MAKSVLSVLMPFLAIFVQRRILNVKHLLIVTINFRHVKRVLTLFLSILIETSVYTACLSSCEEADAACASLFKMAGYAQLLPNCTTETTSIGSPLQPDSSCNNIQSKSTLKKRGTKKSAI